MENSEFHSGFICVVGRPNVGKSSLINLLLGQKIAAVSPRPQTTQRVQLGILSDEETQMIFMDTPGIHKPKTKLNETMIETSFASIADSDVILFLIEATSDDVLNEVRRYSYTSENNPDSNVIRNYLDTVLSLPWNKYSKDTNLHKKSLDLHF